MTPDLFVQLVTQGGGYAVLALWCWSERKERLRLQRVVEGFLPLIAGTHRAISSVKRVVAPILGEEEEDVR